MTEQVTVTVYAVIAHPPNTTSHLTLLTASEKEARKSAKSNLYECDVEERRVTVDDPEVLA